MRIELRKSGGVSCPACGSYELLHVPALNKDLESDLLGFFRQDIPWWRPLKRRRFAYFAREVERVAAELRLLSRYQVS